MAQVFVPTEGEGSGSISSDSVTNQLNFKLGTSSNYDALSSIETGTLYFAESDTNDNDTYLYLNGRNIVPRKAHMVGHGACATAAATAAKVVTIDDPSWTLEIGSIIGVKFSNSNSASSVTLNVNNTGAKNIYYNNAKYTSSSSSICGYKNRTIYYMYDGTYWVWLNAGVLDGNTVPAVQCETAASTAAKVGTCSSHTLLAKSYVHVNMKYTNTYAGKITLNIDSAGAKDIWLNGQITSSTNYNLKAGTYIAYYDGTTFDFRDDGLLPASISGNAATATKATQDGNGNTITSYYAPKSHASTATTYGKGTGSNYGHVKLSDSTSLPSSDVSSGTAATPKAVYEAYDLADSAYEEASYAYTIANNAYTLAESKLSGTYGTEDPDSDTPGYGTNGALYFKIITS